MPIRRWLPILVLTLAALACQTLAGGAGAAAPYYGAFDCYGTEGGLGAYAGRVTLNADGTAIFRNFDDETQTGSWTRDQTTSAIRHLPLVGLFSVRWVLDFRGHAANDHLRFHAVADDGNVAAIFHFLTSPTILQNLVDCPVDGQRGKVRLVRASVFIAHRVRLIDEEDEETRAVGANEF